MSTPMIFGVLFQILYSKTALPHGPATLLVVKQWWSPSQEASLLVSRLVGHLVTWSVTLSVATVVQPASQSAS